MPDDDTTAAERVTTGPPEDRTARAPGPESGTGLDEVLSSWLRALKERQPPAGTPDGLPRLPAPVEVETAEPVDLRRGVRAFHLGRPEPGADLQPPDDQLLPALLQPFRDHGRVRHAYPLFLFPPPAVEDDRHWAPLSELLPEWAAGFAPGADDARLLKDNFRRLERHVRVVLSDRTGPVEAAGCLCEAGRAMLEELSLRSTSAAQLDSELHQLIDAAPKGGALLALVEHAPLHLYLHVARSRAAGRRADLRGRLARLRNRLRELLRVESARDPKAAGPGTIGTAGADYVDADALARVLGPSRGSEPMAPERRRRIEGVLQQLEQSLSEEDRPLVVVVGDGERSPTALPPEVQWLPAGAEGACRDAAVAFDQTADGYARLFAAVRVAQLELAGQYEPARHDALLKTFSWRAFTREELLGSPPVLALDTAQRLAGPGMLDLSRVLLSRRPIDVLVTVQPETDPGARPEDEELTGYRFELAYLGMSHREALVNQTSAARPQHLLQGFLNSLDASRTALHVVASGLSADSRLGAWLRAGAALEGRAHPLFHYNPEAGETWARRLDFSMNPQPEEDWPLYTLPCRTAGGDETTVPIAFTFADFALMDRRYRPHFRVIPPDLPDDDLVTVSDFLALPDEDALDHIPFVWAADEQGQLYRLAVDRRLTFACRDRLDYWRTLQELAGIRNEHIREAVQRERDRLQEEFADERQRLEEAHAEEIDRVRSEAAGQAMQQLAQSLLSTDPAALLEAPPPELALPAPAPTEAPAEAPTEAPTEAPAEEEEEAGFDEPWIDTILCTSCNDCLEINGRLFVYNSNKQAVIGDADAGTFEELVRAAEKCPARCIHPGRPRNPDEPNLEPLIKRAQPFNQ